MPRLQASVTDQAVGVPVDAPPVTVTAGDGVLGTVTMVNEAGNPVDGQLSPPDGLTWATTEPLGYNKQYTLNAEARGLGGIARNSMTFQTASPEKNLTMPYVLPNDGEVVGIGQPVAIRFDEDIPPNRLAAQKAIKVTTNPPVEGAFYWLNNREVRWRPAKYWKPGTTVEVTVNTYGVDLGDGLFGQEDITTRFSIGDEVIATADDNTKTLTVRRNGEVVRSMPLSMGKDSTPHRQRPLHHRRPVFAPDHGLLDLRCARQLTRGGTASRWIGPHRCPTAASMCIPRRGRWAARAAPT